MSSKTQREFCTLCPNPKILKELKVHLVLDFNPGARKKTYVKACDDCYEKFNK
jgi:hypothetical protein